jgi:Ca-activated chloride channel family protein
MTFAHPWVLLLLAVLPLLPLLRRRLDRVQPIPLPGIGDAPWVRGATWRVRLRGMPELLRLCAVGCVVVALARPQETTGWTTTSTEGVAIQVVYDRSGSMREPMPDNESATKNEVARKALVDFVKGDGGSLRGREGDMVGLIAFARFADTISPMARVHGPLLDAAARLQPVENREAEDGTAIGDALALAASRLKRAEEEVARATSREGGKPSFEIKSKVIVLMTDGQNNAGETSPVDAAELSRRWGIRIYAIGVGAGDRTATIDTLFGRQVVSRGNAVDERLLTRIAESTGGAYFSAGTTKSLEDAYAAIDSLEKSRIDSTRHSSKKERFLPLALAAAGLLAAEWLLASLVVRRIT